MRKLLGELFRVYRWDTDECWVVVVFEGRVSVEYQRRPRTRFVVLGDFEDTVGAMAFISRDSRGRSA